MAAGRFLETDPEQALRHAQAARTQAGRIPSVREAVGLAAYRAGQWRLAVAELRAWRRLTGSDAHLPVIADCERALGRPERAIELATAPEARHLDPATRVELLIVAAGARMDLGQAAAAAAMLRIPELTSATPAQGGEVPWVARLRYAYAEVLLAMDDPKEARDWFAAAAEIDEEGATDAGDRLLDLDGVAFVDTADPDQAVVEETPDPAEDTPAPASAPVLVEGSGTVPADGPAVGDSADEVPDPDSASADAPEPEPEPEPVGSSLESRPPAEVPVDAGVAADPTVAGGEGPVA